MPPEVISTPTVNNNRTKYLIIIIGLLALGCLIFFGFKNGIFAQKNKDPISKFLDIQTMNQLLEHTKIVDGAIVSMPQFITLKYKEYERYSAGEIIYNNETMSRIQKDAICQCEIASSTYHEESTPYGIVKQISFVIKDISGKPQGTPPTLNDYMWIEKDSRIIPVFGGRGNLIFDELMDSTIDNFILNKSKNILTYLVYIHGSESLYIYDLKNNKEISDEFSFPDDSSGGAGRPNIFVVSDDGEKFIYSDTLYRQEGQEVQETREVIYVSKTGGKKIIAEIKAEKDAKKDEYGNVDVPVVTGLSFDGDGISYQVKYVDGSSKSFHIKLNQ